MAENKVVGIVEAHKTNKERGNGMTVAEAYAVEVVTGKKKDATAAERAMSIKYLLELDLLRKKQRMASASERRKSKKEKEVVLDVPESVITPELRKRLDELEGK